MSLIIPFRADLARVAPRRSDELAYEVKYLHHTKPHHSDSAARKAAKAQETATARTFETTGTLTYGKPLERWTARDLAGVIDYLREQMPRTSPRPWRPIDLRCLDPSDRYQDGRGLRHLSFNHEPRHPFNIWFSTEAGYSGQITFPRVVPVRAIVQFVLSTGSDAGRCFGVSMDVDHRAVAKLRNAHRSTVGRPARSSSAAEGDNPGTPSEEPV